MIKRGHEMGELILGKAPMQHACVDRDLAGNHPHMESPYPAVSVNEFADAIHEGALFLCMAAREACNLTNESDHCPRIRLFNHIDSYEASP